MMVFICIPLSRRAIQLSLLILHLGYILNPMPLLEGVRIQEGSLCMLLYAFGAPSWGVIGMVAFV